MIRFVFIAMVTLLFACSKGSSNNGGGTGGGGTGGGTCSGTPGPLFNAVKAIVSANCALSGCHSGSNAQNGINFGDNCTIVAQSTRIKLRAVDQAGTANQMPPNAPPLSQADRNAITAWVSAGGRLTD